MPWRRWMFGFFVIGLLGWWSVSPSDSAQERITDEVIHGAFRQAHTVMKDLRTVLQAALDGFLTGDNDLIQTNADHIAQRMTEVAKTFPPEPGREVDEWKAMADITEQARALQAKSHEGNISAAYQHYTLLTNRCIACHQVRRKWGQFPSPQPAAVDQSKNKPAK